MGLLKSLKFEQTRRNLTKNQLVYSLSPGHSDLRSSMFLHIFTLQY